MASIRIEALPTAHTVALTRPLVAVAAGFTASVFLAGMGTSLSLFSSQPLVAHARSSPSALTNQQVARSWQCFYDAGHAIMPKLYIATGVLHLGAAWAASRFRAGVVAAGGVVGTGGEWRGAAAAGALVCAVPLFTITFIMQLNHRIEAHAAGGKHGDVVVDKDEDVVALVDSWTRWNYLRTVLPALSAVAAGWNLVRLVEGVTV
jgi:hypothetical protein